MSDNRDMKSKMKEATDSAQSSARETMEKATAMVQEMNPMHRGDQYPDMDRAEDLAREHSDETSRRHKHPFDINPSQDPRDPMYNTSTEGSPRRHVYNSPLQGSPRDPIYNDPSQLHPENMPSEIHDDGQREHKDKMEGMESDEACMQQEMKKDSSHDQQS